MLLGNLKLFGGIHLTNVNMPLSLPIRIVTVLRHLEVQMGWVGLLNAISMARIAMTDPAGATRRAVMKMPYTFQAWRRRDTLALQELTLLGFELYLVIPIQLQRWPVTKRVDFRLHQI